MRVPLLKHPLKAGFSKKLNGFRFYGDINFIGEIDVNTPHVTGTRGCKCNNLIAFQHIIQYRVIICRKLYRRTLLNGPVLAYGPV